MSAALVARTTPVRSRSTEVLCAGSLSIVVEGVDGEPTSDGCEEVFDDELISTEKGSCQDLTDESFISTPHGGSRRGSRASTKEETETKIAFFKTEAAARLNELERLLDEHDQIIRELQRSESTGGLHVCGTSEGKGASSVPNPASPTDSSRRVQKTSVSKTAPTSPAMSKPRLPE